MQAIVTFRSASGAWKSVECEAKILKTTHPANQAGRGDSSVEAHCDLLERIAPTKESQSA